MTRVRLLAAHRIERQSVWSSYWRDDTWQPLPRTGGAHAAADDGLAVLALLDRLTADLPAAPEAAAPIHARRAALEERDRHRRRARGRR